MRWATVHFSQPIGGMSNFNILSGEKEMLQRYQIDILLLNPGPFKVFINEINYLTYQVCNKI